MIPAESLLKRDLSSADDLLAQSLSLTKKSCFLVNVVPSLYGFIAEKQTSHKLFFTALLTNWPACFI